MAIGVFILTLNQREFVSIVLLVLSFIQVFCGVVMFAIAMYLYITIAPVLYSERAEVNFISGVVAICGVNNIGCFLLGVKIRMKCLKQSHKKSTRNLIFFWLSISFYIMFYLAILAKLVTKVYKHVIRAMVHSFHIGMNKYLKDEVWKISIDEIQYNMQCCGAHSYKEWHETPWLDKYHVNMHSAVIKQFLENATATLPVTPWSCCRLSFPLQCLHDPLQQIRSLNVWADQPSLVTDSINSEGCIRLLKNPIKMSLLTFILLVVIMCFIQVLIFLVTRLLYTSCRNAEILGEPKGPAPGWIFGRGDCGYNTGKSLGQIMHEHQKAVEKIVLEEAAEEEELLIDIHEN